MPRFLSLPPRPTAERPASSVWRVAAPPCGPSGQVTPPLSRMGAVAVANDISWAEMPGHGALAVPPTASAAVGSAGRSTDRTHRSSSLAQAAYYTGQRYKQQRYKT